MAQEVEKKSELATIEEQMLQTWKDEGTFQASMDRNKDKEVFSFYDGPPFANGLPHFGHSLVTSIKDSVLRYKTMRGYYVPRRNGWDCHGLPVEYAIEKEFGVSGKKQIMELGLEKFNAACRASIFTYKEQWEELLQRLGRWSEYDNYYATVDRNYTESVWWALSEINKKDLLYKGFKSTPYCPRCETPLSNFEVNDGYKDNVPDPSLYVKFKLVDEDASLLAWTTTPWSLPGNAAIAVNPEEEYVYVETEGETLVLAKKRLSALAEDTYQIMKEVSGKELIGKKYQPLFSVEGIDSVEGAELLYQVWPANFVSIEDGSGVLHVAPAFGEDDLNLGQEVGLPVITSIDAGGHVKSGYGLDEIAGKFFKGADKLIIERLTKEGKVFSAETFTHTYPFCWRCDTPLMYYAINSWFIKVSEIREDLQATAKDINWTPSHIRDGRFGKWVANARDWSISRNRYWGAPMPVWANVEDENDYIVVGSIAELKELAGDDIKVDDLHRPFIDDIEFDKDGKHYKRIEEVLDCWFESGAMSVGQQHYPFENQETFKDTFPADFITEAIDQTRLWFYVQHVVNTILFNRPAYRNVIVTGFVMAADGQKLSKRLKNYPPVEEVLNQEGADSLRLYLLSQHQMTETADYMRFNRDAMKDINRNVLGTLMNSVRFFSMYTKLDNWQPAKPGERPEAKNPLDAWMLARLDQTVAEVTKQADDYKLAHSLHPIFELIDDMSNWYIRRSRRRFWKSEDDGDKQQAYEVLWYTLTRLCQLLAPFAPFLSDHVWRELTVGTDLPNSVHLTDWPEAHDVDSQVLADMSAARAIITDALAQRAAAKIKVRQPLARLTIPGMPNDLHEIIAEEVNVKEVVEDGDDIVLDLEITPELKREGLMRDVIRAVQNARKQAGLNVEDRITLRLQSDDSELVKAIEEHADTIKLETLATDIETDVANEITVAKIEGAELHIGLSKIS